LQFGIERVHPFAEDRERLRDRSCRRHVGLLVESVAGVDLVWSGQVLDGRPAPVERVEQVDGPAFDGRVVCRRGPLAGRTVVSPAISVRRCLRTVPCLAVAGVFAHICTQTPR